MLLLCVILIKLLFSLQPPKKETLKQMFKEARKFVNVELVSVTFYSPFPVPIALLFPVSLHSVNKTVLSRERREPINIVNPQISLARDDAALI